MILTTFGFGQERLVLPGQELLYPSLTDPSFIGEERRTQITALGQFVDFDSDRASQYVNAQLPIYNNLSFGVDYFKNKLDFYNYSQVFLSAAFEIPIGEMDHIKIGLAGGGESLKLDRVPTGQQSGTLIPNINENNIEFTYRLGLHYSGRNITLGGSYINLPAQQVEIQQDDEDLLNYELIEGYTAYLGYRIRVGQTFAVTPMFRYLSFTDDAIYEGSVKLELKDKLDITLAYRNDYSLNPAIRFEFFKSLAVGYSYEKAIGNLVFDDIHSFSLSYKFNKANADDEPEWMETAKENIEKTEAIEEEKPKQSDVVDEKVATEEVAPKEEIKTEEAPVKSEVSEVAEESITEQEKIVAENKVQESVKSKKQNSRAVTIVMSSRFYLVAKSFDRYDDAYIFQKNLDENGIDALIGVIENDKKYYVFLASEGDKKTANNHLAGYKMKDILKDTYVLEVD